MHGGVVSSFINLRRQSWIFGYCRKSRYAHSSNCETRLTVPVERDQRSGTIQQMPCSTDTALVHINETLGGKMPLARADIAAFVQEAKLDLDLWFE